MKLENVHDDDADIRPEKSPLNSPLGMNANDPQTEITKI